MLQGYRGWVAATSQATKVFSNNTDETVIWMKKLEGHHSITMDPRTMHIKMREWGKGSFPYPKLRCNMARLLEDREKFNPLCQSTCGGLVDSLSLPKPMAPPGIQENRIPGKTHRWHPLL